MNATKCVGFRQIGDFLSVIRGWKGQPACGCTYLVVCDRKISRLQGSSDILYVGQTGKLGGKNNRLWNYYYATQGNVTEYRVRECVKKLVTQRYDVTLHICQSPPNSMNVAKYESALLTQYRVDHCDSPPLN